jgi:hypothetical protein
MRPLPHRPDGILLNRPVRRTDHQPMSDGLANQDPVEGIAMDWWQLGKLGHCLLGDRQRIEPMTLTLHHQVCCSRDTAT